MDAGRDLDAVVERSVFKNEVVKYSQIGRPDFYYKSGDALVLVPQYSTHIAAAWRIVDKIKGAHEKTIFHLDFFSNQWTCGFEKLNHDYMEIEAEAPTAPLAICLVALKVETKSASVRE